MKVLIFGAGGMAGHVVARYLTEQQYEVISIHSHHDTNKNHIKVDVTNESAVRTILKEHSPSIVINCVGLLVKPCEDSPMAAYLINTQFPKILEKYSSFMDFKLIHISTDCVFSGSKGQYTEKDVPDETNKYGTSKAAGEIILPPNLTIRTSIIGPELKSEGTGLMHWFLHKSEYILNGYTNAFWNGVTTLELAKFIDQAIKENISGLAHIHCKEKVSKYELLNVINNIYNVNKVIKPITIPVTIDKTIVKTRNDFQYNLKTITEQLEELHDWYNQKG